ncbi:MAG: sugar transferase [Thermogutta sp.]
MSLPVRNRSAAMFVYDSGIGNEKKRLHSVPDILPSPYFRWQPILGWIIAAIATPVFLPVIAFLVVLVRLTSRGPGLYRQQRVGKHGKVFWIYKIRTMPIDAEAKTGPVWTDENDPRITPVGRWLRRFHLDELPQLLNVLKGEMTLIGPRPERPEFTQHLARAIPGYLARYLVLPGITGLAQINLPPDRDLDSVRRKLVLDLEYLEKADFWLDFRIMLCTALKMLGLPGLKIAGWLKLCRPAQVPPWMYNGKHNGSQLPVTYLRAAQGIVNDTANKMAKQRDENRRNAFRKPR